MVDVIAKLKAWRTANKLSQRQAVEVMNAHGFPVALRTLQSWELSKKTPSQLRTNLSPLFLAELRQCFEDLRLNHGAKSTAATKGWQARLRRKTGRPPLLHLPSRLGIHRSINGLNALCLVQLG